MQRIVNIVILQKNDMEKITITILVVLLAVSVSSASYSIIQVKALTGGEEAKSQLKMQMNHCTDLIQKGKHGDEEAIAQFKSKDCLAVIKDYTGHQGHIIGIKNPFP